MIHALLKCSNKEQEQHKMLNVHKHFYHDLRGHKDKGFDIDKDYETNCDVRTAAMFNTYEIYI